MWPEVAQFMAPLSRHPCTTRNRTSLLELQVNPEFKGYPKLPSVLFVASCVRVRPLGPSTLASTSHAVMRRILATCGAARTLETGALKVPDRTWLKTTMPQPYVADVALHARSYAALNPKLPPESQAKSLERCASVASFQCSGFFITTLPCFRAFRT